MEDKTKSVVTDTSETAEVQNTPEQGSETQHESAHKVQWYLLHTYSGYENKIKLEIERMAQQKGWWGSLICELCVPEETYTVAETGRKRGSSAKSDDGLPDEEATTSKTRRVKAGRMEKTRKRFPSYVLIKMFINDETWYYVRNTRGVTGFVGSGPTPVPLSEDEVKQMLGEQEVEVRREVKFEVNDAVRILSGPFSNMSGTIQSIDAENDQITIDAVFMSKHIPVITESSNLVKI